MLAEKVGAKIRLLRQARNYSQENLAEQLGIHLQAMLRSNAGSGKYQGYIERL
jgi:transcriptional regulator with XRE-family HTH domain